MVKIHRGEQNKVKAKLKNAAARAKSAAASNAIHSPRVIKGKPSKEQKRLEKRQKFLNRGVICFSL